MNPAEIGVEDRQAGILLITSEIVQAYVGNNSVPKADLPGLIASVYAAVTGCVEGAIASPGSAEVEKPTEPQIRASIRPDGITSFVDGKSYKTLKRHLTGHGLTPEGYRSRYGLPPDYPMVAPNYSAQRSALAKNLGLGRGGQTANALAA